MTREELQKVKSKDLQKMATAVGIKNSRQYRKDTLVEMLAEDGAGAPIVPGEDCKPIQEQPDEAVVKEALIDYEGKMRRIENIGVGTIVAFETEDGKVKSAKVINKSTKNKKLKAETSYGKIYIVPFDKVIWVKTGARWPRGVYNLLKGIGTTNGEETSTENENGK